MSVFSTRIFLWETANDEKVVRSRVEGGAVLREVLIESVRVLDVQVSGPPIRLRAADQSDSVLRGRNLAYTDAVVLRGHQEALPVVREAG